MNYENFPSVLVSEFGERIGPYPLCRFGADFAESDYIWSGDGFDETYASGRGLVHVGKCGGFVDLDEISETHYALICRACQLRVVVPLKIKTWKQLRNYFEKVL